MPRKIYDIKPPKVVQKVQELPEEVVQDNGKKNIKKTTPVRRKKGKRSIWKPVSISLAVIVLIICVYLYFKLPKADIVLWPKVDTLSFQQTVTADKSVDTIDLTKAVIPAQYFESAKTNAQDFPATGTASNQGMASGIITIYNKYDPPTPFTLRSGTHFMSDSGKLFVASQKIVIPAAKKSGGKITPGSIQIKVQAVEAGSDYNIAPANFSVPGLKGTAYYYSIYATSDTAMAGGYTGKVKKVTDDDIQGAKDVLTNKTTSDAIAALKSQISSDYVVSDNAVFSNVKDASTQIQSGAIADKFNYSVTVQASTLAFRKSDIEQFARNYIVSQIPEGKTMLSSSFKTDYSSSNVDVSGGKATINLNFSAGVYQNIDKNSITLSLLGENPDQVKATVKSSLGDAVSQVQIKLWPFWVFSVPNSQNAVTVGLKFQ